MNALSDAAAAARKGRSLVKLVGSYRDRDKWSPVQLSVTQQHDLLDLWTTLFTDVYVHYEQKRALYGFDPIRALSALRRQIPYLDSEGFLRALTLLINTLRDQHTQLFTTTANRRLTGYVAALPFLIEPYGPHLSPIYLVTKTTDDIADASFRAGATVTTWNSVPIDRCVDLYAETLTGGRPDARRARALETLTQRPLDYLPLPDERWIDIGYRLDTDAPSSADHTLHLVWRAIKPENALRTDHRIESSNKRAINATGEQIRRARKLLFATALWDKERSGERSAAKADDWMSTNFPDAVSARKVKTRNGTFGYLRLWTFDVSHTHRFMDEIAAILKKMPRKGLIIDIRANPGGVIEAAERLFQLLTNQPISPVRFACRATPAMVAITDADGNGADLADWSSSTRSALELGEAFSQHLPISDPEDCNALKQVYKGPVVVVVDANTFSSGDIFAAGILDHGIGQVVSVGDATGAGGANVWMNESIEYAYHAADRELPPLPDGISFSISIRRIVRTGYASGLAIEDIGIAGEERYEMTKTDVLDGNRNLIHFCSELLSSV